MTEATKPLVVQRTCTRQSAKSDERESRALESYREWPAYVLLGDPGAGKSTSFKWEAEATCGIYVKARDFATFGPAAAIENKTLFIDGLDEMRAGAGDGRTPLDHIRRHLQRLGGSRFRLSCREADWLGASDREALISVAPGGKISVLHLDPLNDCAIAEILGTKTAVPDAGEFVHKAEEHELGELLRNPQTLDLLVEAVGGNTWPNSREATYEMACRQLVRERNLEHRQATRGQAIHAAKLLDAAGYLCSVHLLSGIAGYALDEDAADKQYFSWKNLGTQYDAPLLAALKTRLFQSDGEERRIPIHRSVAEYLGARHLAVLVEKSGLPLGRVLALIAGEDGGIVPDLRGLAAWLSVHCHSGRATLIERDPLGAVLYGDVRNFPADDKRRLLATLRDEAKRYPWFRSHDWTSSPFGALGTPEMVPTFREIFSSPSRDDADQALLDCVIDAIRHGAALPELDNLLEAVARDTSYWQTLREEATRVLLHRLADTAPRLLRLVDDVRAGAVEDRDDELLGVLLRKLYPRLISAEHILDYLHHPKNSNSIRTYFMFWTHDLANQTDKSDFAVLLDQLVQRHAALENTLKHHQLGGMTGELLTRALEAHGETITDQRLYGWLGADLGEYDKPRLDTEHAKRVALWLSNHPERYKSLLTFGASQCVRSEKISYCLFNVSARLYGATTPNDIGSWYLDQAARQQLDEVAQYYFMRAVHQLIQEGGQKELTVVALEFLESWTQDHPRFQPWLEGFTSLPIDHYLGDQAKRNKQWKIERRQRRDEWTRYFRQHLAEIKAGTAHAKILHDLAMAYRKLFYDIKGETPRERLLDFLGGDTELVDAAYEGFRRALERKDLPSVAEIVDLELKGQMHFISQACLVGMDEIYQADPAGALKLDDDVLSRVLAFRLTYSAGNDPAWFGALVQKRPDLMAAVLVAYALPLLRRRREHISGLYALAHDATYAEVARMALPDLLVGFPLRARKQQLSNSLSALLKAALRHLDKKLLTSLVADKLEQDSMDVAQRVYWLTCGLLLAPKKYESLLVRHIGASKVRRGYLGAFLCHREEYSFALESLPETTLALLIELLAPDSPSKRPEGAYWVSPAMETADGVRSLIATLGGIPSATATRALERLEGLPSLASWKSQIGGALHAQRVARRKANFRHLSAEEVCRTLSNLQPANAADLAALTLDHLNDIAEKIRNGGTNDYRQYWSHDESNKKLTKPKPENDCRDALLSDLNERLGRLGIDASKEGYYAEDKRADIKVSFGGVSGFNVPIEIKKDNHADLWRAIRGQLITQYVRDPGTGGYGIYLVFWFGGKDMPPPADGKRPRGPLELQNRLRQTLTPEEQHRILVCVVDCALP